MPSARIAIQRHRDPRHLSPRDRGELLADDVRRGDRNHLERLVRLALPEWRVKLALLRAAHELLDLRLAVGLAVQSGLSASLACGLRDEVDAASSGLARVMTRLSLLDAQDIGYPQMSERLAWEAQRLAGLAATARQARQDLARLTLEGTDPGDVTRAQWVLQSLADMATGLQLPANPSGRIPARPQAALGCDREECAHARTGSITE